MTEASRTKRRINVAFVVSPGANVIDLAGAWEVFQDVGGNNGAGPFQLYMVSDDTRQLTGTGGMLMTPHYSLQDAPKPDVVSIGAQRGSERIHAWLREQAPRVDVMMSVCTGAFQLARAGLLEGKRATTHHEFWDSFTRQFPATTLIRGPRFVVDGNTVSAGGLTSGIDSALHVVEAYLGRERAQATADYMEYRSELWKL